MSVGAEDARLWFQVCDDGVGFDPSAAEGHGFLNMRDRLGALGGTLTVRSRVGGGTSVCGSVPATAMPQITGRTPQ